MSPEQEEEFRRIYEALDEAGRKEIADLVWTFVCASGKQDEVRAMLGVG